MSFPYARIAGKLAYRRPDGSERGREWFSMHSHGRGRVIRAVCEMDEEHIIRDATWSVDLDWRPVNGYVQVVSKDVIVGSSWFSIAGDTATCEAQTAKAGRISQTLKTPGPIDFLGLHPVLADGQIAAVYGYTHKGVERVINSVTCSYAPNGDEGLTALPIAIGVTYVGEEALTVPAGTFTAQRFAIRWRPEWPPADYWVFGEGFIHLKSQWSISDMTIELDELETAT